MKTDIPTLRLWFTDMWGYGEYLFNPRENYFTWLFQLKYRVILDSQNPDILIYSCFGNQHHNYKCKKLFFTGENTIPKGVIGRKIVPDPNECNASLSYSKQMSKIYIFHWVIFINWFGKKSTRSTIKSYILDGVREYYQ